jgi:hypothetical protein
MGQGTGKLLTKEGIDVTVGLTRIGRVKGQIRISDSKGSITVTDMDLKAGDIADKIAGSRSVSVSFGTNLVADDPGYTAARSQYKAGTLGNLTVRATSRDGTTVWSETYYGEFTTFDTTLNEDNVGESAIVFEPSQIVTAE